MPARVYRHGKWWRFVPPPPGTPIKLGQTKPEALRAYAELMERGDRLTVGQVMDRYASEITPTKAASSQRTECSALKKLRQWCGHVPLAEIRTQHVYNYLDTRGQQSAAAANKELSLLKSIYQKAIRWGYVGSNPCVGVERITLHARRF